MSAMRLRNLCQSFGAIGTEVRLDIVEGAAIRRRPDTSTDVFDAGWAKAQPT